LVQTLPNRHFQNVSCFLFQGKQHKKNMTKEGDEMPQQTRIWDRWVANDRLTTMNLSCFGGVVSEQNHWQ